jgi:hypothetical protein
MANLGDFNATEVKPNRGFDPLPAGRYLATVTASEKKPTKDGTGSYLNLEFTVLEGEFKGRKVWDRLCLNHPNPQAVKIALSNLSALCHAVGVLKPGDSVALHNIPFVLTLGVKKRTDTGDLTNDVRAYSKREAAAGPPQTVQADAPPWQR